jgi:single-strand DNA-binding protein
MPSWAGSSVVHTQGKRATASTGPHTVRVTKPQPRHCRVMTTANEVHLTGRISATPQQRQLPSGDVVMSFRLVVPRTRAAQRRTRQRVDTVECSVWTSRLRRAVASLSAGDRVSVSGELRRTFRRQGAGVTSWVTVDVAQVQRVTDPAART